MVKRGLVVTRWALHPCHLESREAPARLRQWRKMSKGGEREGERDSRGAGFSPLKYNLRIKELLERYRLCWPGNVCMALAAPHCGDASASFKQSEVPAATRRCPGCRWGRRRDWPGPCCLGCGDRSLVSSLVCLHALCVSFAPLRDVGSAGLPSAQRVHRARAIEGFVLRTCR